MRIKVISFTARGNELNKNMSALFCGEQVEHFGRGDGLRPLDCALRSWTEEAFYDSDAIIFIGAAGIAVRAIAPFIQTKDVDPAVLVLDEAGGYVIPILSGHLGGANRLAQRIADEIGAQAVITTATDVSGVFAADTWAREHGCAVVHIEEIKHISAALLRGDTVGFASDFPITGTLPEGLSLRRDLPVGIVISLDSERQVYEKTLHLIPVCVHVGVGCRRDADTQMVKRFVLDVLQEHHISAAAVKTFASIDIKSREPALLRLSECFGKPLVTYTAEQLNHAPGVFTSSEFVKNITGTDNVCERASALSANGGARLFGKTACGGVTAAAAMETWRAEF